MSAAPVTPALSAKQDAGEQKSAITIQPHRATYTLSLGQHKNTSEVDDVDGSITLEWADVCDGWVVHQKSTLNIGYATGDEITLTANETSWESKDGKKYSFSSTHKESGKPAEQWQGHASMESNQAKAKFSKPEEKTITLADNTIFPIAHTREMLEHAMKGENFFSRTVFTGTSSMDTDIVSAFISPASTGKLLTEVSDKQKLISPSYWPVHLAYFKDDTETGSPDYEMDLDLQANGVARSLAIDFGDYVIRGKLKEIVSLPPKKC